MKNIPGIYDVFDYCREKHKIREKHNRRCQNENQRIFVFNRPCAKLTIPVGFYQNQTDQIFCQNKTLNRQMGI